MARYFHLSESHLAFVANRRGYRPSMFRLNRVLYARAWISNARPSVMFEIAAT